MSARENCNRLGVKPSITEPRSWHGRNWNFAQFSQTPPIALLPPSLQTQHKALLCNHQLVVAMVRLTTELVSKAPSYINPVKDRELDLRGNRIPQIENLGVSKVGSSLSMTMMLTVQDQNDAIDLTDNDIRQLHNLPRLRRLRTLFLGRNRIESIAPTIGESCPNLTTLVLTSNAIAELADLEPLRECKKLTFLSLLDNPVTRKDNYRLYVIFILPHLRLLDFRRIKDAVWRLFFPVSLDANPLFAF